jgi:hypothetical protein
MVLDLAFILFYRNVKYHAMRATSYVRRGPTRIDCFGISLAGFKIISLWLFESLLALVRSGSVLLHTRNRSRRSGVGFGLLSRRGVGLGSWHLVVDVDGHLVVS